MTVFIFDDGGRSAAGFKGSAGDCVCRAATIATGKPYAEIYAMIGELSASERGRMRRGKKRKSSARTGVFTSTIRKLMEALGSEWHPTMQVGSGCTVHLRADELPAGRIICSLSKHLVAMIDGVIHDTDNPSRGGTRCVYGYWRFP